MYFLDSITDKRASLMSSVNVLYSSMSDPRIKWYVKILSLLIVAYVISPIDMIPDFIPVLGLLDEVILVPIALSFIVRLIPREIYNELSTNEQGRTIDKKIIYISGIFVISVWLTLPGFIYYLWL